jgi:hypothetical protein
MAKTSEFKKGPTVTCKRKLSLVMVDLAFLTMLGKANMLLGYKPLILTKEGLLFTTWKR